MRSRLIQIEDSDKNEDEDDDDEKETADQADPVDARSHMTLTCTYHAHVPTAPFTSGTLPFISASSGPTNTHSEATTTSVPPSTRSTLPASSSSLAISLTSILPTFSDISGRKVSLRVLIPLLQDSLLGMLNHKIRSHDETRDVILRTL